VRSTLSITAGSSLAFLAVAFGAFGAHGLKGTLSTDMLVIYHTAVDYHMWHAIGLLIVGLQQQHKPSSLLNKSAYFMFAGICLFSGSLYALSLSANKMLGIITPIGGVCLLIAWALLAIASTKSN